MFPRALLAAVLVAVCANSALSATPFAVNHTELRRTHPLRATNTAPPRWGRRRARHILIQLTSPSQLGSSRSLAASPPRVSSPRASPPIESSTFLSTSPPGPYWANDSLVGMPVECSDAAKTCLTIKRLLHEPTGRCYELGDTRPCGDDGAALVLDAEAFRQGRLRSTCRQPHSCEGFSMAYDGKCYEAWDVFGKFCNGTKGIVYHPLGGLECRKQKEMNSTGLQIIRQPSSQGRCIVPNFQNTEIGPFWVKCTSAEEQCLKMGLLPFADGCHVPLSNTTCAEGQWLVMDERAAHAGQLNVRCVPERRCGRDAHLLRANGECHSNKELSEKLCNGYLIVPLPTGEAVCTLRSKRFEVVGLGNGKGQCEVRFDPIAVQSAGGAIGGGGVSCVLNEDKVCQPDVISPTPKPDVGPED